MSSCSVLQKLREPKILDMSIFDWATSLGAAVVVGLWMHLKGSVRWIGFLVAWTLAGVAIHWVLGVDTMLGYYLELNKRPVRKACV